MALFPIFLNLQDKNCLIIGGGPVAERKARSLVECGARVRLVSPQVTPGLADMAGSGLLDWKVQNYEEQDLEGMVLVFIATDQTGVNQKVARACSLRGILVNAVDDPPHCDFYVPSILRRQSLVLAVSTEGKSPLFARKLREELEEIIPDDYGRFVEMLGRIRDQIKDRIPDIEQRQAVFAELLSPEMLGWLKAGKEDLIKERVEKCISSWRA